jgi:hypothetical protein
MVQTILFVDKKKFTDATSKIQGMIASKIYDT